MTTNNPYVCCDRRKVVILSTPRRELCAKHLDPETRARLARIDELAQAVGAGRGRWPYGLSTNLEAREAMVEWACRHGLRWVYNKPKCIHWLRTSRCQLTRCRDRNRGFEDLRQEGIDLSGDNSSWFDHVTTWCRGRQSAVLVAQPYYLNDGDRDALNLLGSTPGLSVEIDDAGGWYGKGTTWVGIWR